jgi:hypothetical protein
VHRLCRVEPANLEQLVRWRAAAAPSEVAALALASFHAAPDLSIDGAVERVMREVSETMRRDVAKAKALETHMTHAQEFGREGRHCAVMAHANDGEGQV